MFWFKRKRGNRRTGRAHDVLDVKLRSSQVRAARTRMIALGFGLLFGTVFGLYVLWRIGDWGLDRLVYENTAFAIKSVDIESDGLILPDQLRRWSGVRRGDNLFALDLARVKHALELVPRIQSASVERILPDTVRIRVAEREPVARINVPRLDSGRLEMVVFEIDGEGCVMLPMDARHSQAGPRLDHVDVPLPEISGINLTELLPGRRIESRATQAALRFIEAFDSSPMAGVVEVKRIDVASPQVLVVTSGQGSEVTFALEGFERQLLCWREVHQECVRLNKVIATLDLAVNNNPPLRVVEATPTTPMSPKNAKPQRNRRRNV